jgi:AraC family transcriptional regulator, regulatory protein of adaptative response / methylated-DNA-[protein]-cysteine methyltransferase
MKVITKTASKSIRGRGKTIVWGMHDFPVGKILVAMTAEGLCWLGINCSAETLYKNWKGAEFIEDKAVTAKTAKEIAKRWPDSLEKISVPIALYGTAFQLKVWKELLKIKSGKTVTYEEIAKKIGKPKAVRAVGSAVGRNTVSIVVPCHRVINKSSNRINYGWGPAIKKALLKGEKAAI